MKATIKLDIECGENTCASEPGKFCRLLTYYSSGKAICYIFGEVRDHSEDGLGWIQRHPDCLKYTSGEVDVDKTKI